MGLSVYLISQESIVKNGTGVFVRENGKNRELTSEEVLERWPDSNVDATEYESNKVYWANITHNLNAMAQEAFIYNELWRPDEIGIEKASQLITPLMLGLSNLRANPEHFKQFNPKNGWGSYEGLVNFVKEYLKACIDYPDALVGVSR